MTHNVTHADNFRRISALRRTGTLVPQPVVSRLENEMVGFVDWYQIVRRGIIGGKTCDPVPEKAMIAAEKIAQVYLSADKEAAVVPRRLYAPVFRDVLGITGKAYENFIQNFKRKML